MSEPGPYIEHIFGDELQDLYQGHRGWITCAVHHSIPWPEKGVAITYDGRQYFLRGLKEQGDEIQSACISVKTNTGEEQNSILRDIYKFTSILGWFKRGYVDVVGQTSGSYAIRYGAGNQMFIPSMSSGIYGFNCNYMPLITHEATRIALAFWREGLKLEHIHSSYSFLSFYKVIESQFSKGKEKGRWITDALPALEGKAKSRIEELESQEIDVSKHIFESGRCAVAHASLDGDIIDPDIPEDKRQIQNDLYLVRSLAEKYIREELGVPDEMDVLRNRNNLEPIFVYLTDAHIEELNSGGAVLKKRVGLNGLFISVAEWPHASQTELRELEIVINQAHNGVVFLSASNKENDLCLSFTLDFTEGKAHTNLDNTGFLSLEHEGRANSAIAFLKYQKAVIGNGTIEIIFPNGEIVNCEVVIPVNTDIGRTFEAIDEQIKAIEESQHEG